jgi:cellobiose epimerase
LNHIIDKENHHLVLFFDEKWNVKSHIISYGHDIEAAWLIQEAAEIIDDKDLIEKVKIKSVRLANIATEGLDKDGGLWYEYDSNKNYLIKEKHSWPQAESMIGFFNAWQLTGDERFFKISLSSWKFVQEHILDRKTGEWFWGVKENYSLMNEDKVGMWKCPYHNSRTCIELIKRIDTIIKNYED